MAEDLSEQIEALRQQLALLEAQQQVRLTQQGSSAVASDGSVAGGARAVVVGGGVERSIIVTGNGAQIVVGEQPVRLTTVQRESALGRYLNYVISRNRYLQLQGIRSGGRLVNIELEHIYITLRATRTRSLAAEEAWLATERELAPGEAHRLQREPHTETRQRHRARGHGRTHAPGDSWRSWLWQDHAAALPDAVLRARLCRGHHASTGTARAP